MNRSRLIRITAAFFAVMLCFTILSRAADQAGIAAVHVQKPESRIILHTVAAAGKVVQNREVAIVTEPDERVVEIAVEKGQKVAKGDLLFTIDTELLQEKILNQRQEIEKQKLQLGDVGKAGAHSHIDIRLRKIFLQLKTDAGQKLPIDGAFS